MALSSTPTSGPSSFACRHQPSQYWPLARLPCVCMCVCVLCVSVCVRVCLRVALCHCLCCLSNLCFGWMFRPVHISFLTTRPQSTLTPTPFPQSTLASTPPLDALVSRVVSEELISAERDLWIDALGDAARGMMPAPPSVVMRAGNKPALSMTQVRAFQSCLRRIRGKIGVR